MQCFHFEKVKLLEKKKCDSLVKSSFISDLKRPPSFLFFFLRYAQRLSAKISALFWDEEELKSLT